MTYFVRQQRDTQQRDRQRGHGVFVRVEGDNGLG